jgi:hypothetical protein
VKAKAILLFQSPPLSPSGTSLSALRTLPSSAPPRNPIPDHSAAFSCFRGPHAPPRAQVSSSQTGRSSSHIILLFTTGAASSPRNRQTLVHLVPIRFKPRVVSAKRDRAFPEFQPKAGLAAHTPRRFAFRARGRGADRSWSAGATAPLSQRGVPPHPTAPLLIRLRPCKLGPLTARHYMLNFT